jgi:beta-galactosidase
MLTLYHWPIPLWLHDPIKCKRDLENSENKGWLDNRTIVEFTKFVAYVAHKFGDLVDLYCTINEPRIISEHGYLSEKSEFPPGLYDPELYLRVMRNLAIAHGLAYTQVKKFDQTSFSNFGPSTVGLVPVLQVFDPYDEDNDEDIEATRLIEYAFNEWGLNAVFHGDFDMNLDYVIQPEEQKPRRVKGCDFLGVNYYSRWKIKYVEKSDLPLGNFKLMPCEGDCTDYGWEIFPEGFRKVLNWAHRKYRRPIYVTENGIADDSGETRNRYLVTHIEKLYETIVEDKVPVLGYFHWTLMDNFEWSDGFNMHFGLYRVNRKTKERIPTKSVEVYRNISSTNSI